MVTRQKNLPLLRQLVHVKKNINKKPAAKWERTVCLTGKLKQRIDDLCTNDTL